MKKLSFITVLLFALLNSYAQVKSGAGKPPLNLTGSFVDDYGIEYKITDTLWFQLPATRFHIIKWNTEKQYVIAKNDQHNPGERGLYTRIDYMMFDKMEPWKWGYCLTAYDAPSDAAAEKTAAADRDNPMKGCNGYPFSRMRVAKK